MFFLFLSGVIGAALAASLLTYLIYFRRLTRKPRILNGIINMGVVFYFGDGYSFPFFS